MHTYFALSGVAVEILHPAWKCLSLLLFIYVLCTRIPHCLYCVHHNNRTVLFHCLHVQGVRGVAGETGPPGYAVSVDPSCILRVCPCMHGVCMV